MRKYMIGIAMLVATICWGQIPAPSQPIEALVVSPGETLRFGVSGLEATTWIYEIDGYPCWSPLDVTIDEVSDSSITVRVPMTDSEHTYVWWFSYKNDLKGKYLTIPLVVLGSRDPRPTTGVTFPPTIGSDGTITLQARSNPLLPPKKVVLPPGPKGPGLPPPMKQISPTDPEWDFTKNGPQFRKWRKGDIISVSHPDNPQGDGNRPTPAGSGVISKEVSGSGGIGVKTYEASLAYGVNEGTAFISTMAEEIYYRDIWRFNGKRFDWWSTDRGEQTMLRINFFLANGTVTKTVKVPITEIRWVTINRRS